MSVRVLRFDDPDLSAPGDSTRVEAEEPDDLEGEFGEDEAENDPELCLYRGRTVILLRRYLRMSLEAGRLPSLLGREFFRTHFTAYQAHTFEDVVIFVHDVEASLEELDEADRKLIAMIALQEHSQEEAARLLGYTRRSISRHYAEALDRVSEIFLHKRILEPFPCIDLVRENSCQEGKIDDLAVSDCDHGKNNFAKNGQLPPVV
jgi:DNA-directed RNA polymerase specialized sigma24 family protein